MKEDKWQRNAVDLMWENLIRDLLEGRVPGESELYDRLQSCNWVPGRNMSMVSIDMSRFNDPSFIDYFRLQIHKLAPRCRSIYYNDTVSVLIEFPDLSDFDSQMEIIRCFLKENGLYAGCSDFFSNLSDIGRYYRQSRKALFFSGFADTKRRMADYRDHIMNDFVHEASLHVPLLDFCHKGVIALHEYDRKNGTDYYRTLWEYLKNNKNVIATSEVLFVHRNTVNYRLEKIRELLGTQFRETEETLHILMTYKMMEILKFQSSALK
jgi:hypothetical protein